MSQGILIVGAGGHAKVVADALLCAGLRVLGFIDRDPGKHGQKICGLPVLGDDGLLATYPPDRHLLANGIGSIGAPGVRRDIFQTYTKAGYQFISGRHPSAVIGREVEIGAASFIMAGCVVQPGVVIGRNVIVNTGACIDHDCVVGDHVHIAPGAILCGNVSVGEATHVGAGAVVIQGLAIGRECMIGAGAVVVATVADGTRVIGLPGKPSP